MTPVPKTVGELPADATVLKLADSTVVHLPDARDVCLAVDRAPNKHDPVEKSVGVLWDDTEICDLCAEAWTPRTGEATLPTSTEVSQ